MHSRGFCHRDLKPWNIMLSNDLSSAKVIDFSYSTPLKASDIKLCPKLNEFLPGTRYFMAPEQLNRDTVPIMQDFSKLDVWALGVLLINMLTLDFAFVNPLDSEEDMEKFQSFIKSPTSFFKRRGVTFRSKQEAAEISNLLRQCLVIDLKDRCSVEDIKNSAYVKNYSKFVDDKTGKLYEKVNKKFVREVMEKRANVDLTLQMIS
mmetsp:Transcript_14645/g.24955  ORF Transcript_14645/g.24955 Transcript_14645/m.24955 type:complete len:205 (-) Transcript_14645:524-1138(-)